MKFLDMIPALWGPKSRFSWLFLAAILLLMSWLGAREIWTQEHRWADIVAGMFFRHDFFHPYLGEGTYYDKPLLSYWLIALFSQLLGGLSASALRLPSVCAGLLALWSIYYLGCKLKNKQFGLVSGWLLLTTFYFVFWARTSSADMLNLAGSLLAIAWYVAHKHRSDFTTYAIFFLILAVTSLCKGLIGAVVPLIAVAVDLILAKSWKQHLRFTLLFATLPAVLIYLLPFLASSYLNSPETYQQNGLYLVYKENILRYFQPFDHQGPIYTYLIYLPVYLLPWTIFLPGALWSIKNRWREMTYASKWISLTLLALFIFFSLSGSRRSYYVLPMLPFAVLLIADWLMPYLNASLRWSKLLAGSILLVFIVLFLYMSILPAWYYSEVGARRFADQLRQEASIIKPWHTWQIVLLDAESKLNFYLQLSPYTPKYEMKGELRGQQTKISLLHAWPILANPPANTIFISRKLYQPLLQDYFTDYRLLTLPPPSFNWMKKKEVNEPIAFLPLK